MDCLNYAYHTISTLHDIYYDDPEITAVHVIKVSECCNPDEFEISRTLLSGDFKNAKVIQKSDPNEINGTYWIFYPDEDTLLIIIEDLDGNTHLISNDCSYLQYALTEFVFKDRQHLNTYLGECDIEYHRADEEKYFGPFIRELDEYFKKRIA
jgi:hypothetical protein